LADLAEGAFGLFFEWLTAMLAAFWILFWLLVTLATWREADAAALATRCDLHAPRAFCAALSAFSELRSEPAIFNTLLLGLNGKAPA
jgi:hypothetical protein